MNWPSLRRPIQAPKQLLVEGRTPEIFFREWVEAMNLTGQILSRGKWSVRAAGWTCRSCSPMGLV